MNYISERIIACFKRSGKLLICGNGGSATMSSHMAAEFINKFEHDRKPLPAIALTTDMANITSIANDYDFTEVFARQVEALGKKGDILILITTSDMSKPQKEPNHSRNLINAATLGLKKGLEIIWFPRKGKTTAEIQEFQLKRMHDICREVELNFL